MISTPSSSWAPVKDGFDINYPIILKEPSSQSGLRLFTFNSAIGLSQTPSLLHDRTAYRSQHGIHVGNFGRGLLLNFTRQYSYDHSRNDSAEAGGRAAGRVRDRRSHVGEAAHQIHSLLLAIDWLLDTRLHCVRCVSLEPTSSYS